MRDDGSLIQVNAVLQLKISSLGNLPELESLLGNVGLPTFIYTCDIPIYFLGIGYEES